MNEPIRNAPTPEGVGRNTNQQPVPPVTLTSFAMSSDLIGQMGQRAKTTTPLLQLQQLANPEERKALIQETNEIRTEELAAMPDYVLLQLLKKGSGLGDARRTLQEAVQSSGIALTELSQRLREFVEVNKPLAVVFGATMAFFMIDAVAQMELSGNADNIPAVSAIFGFMQTLQAGTINAPVHLETVSKAVEQANQGNFAGMGELGKSMLDAMGEMVGKGLEGAMLFAAISQLFERLGTRRKERIAEVQEGRGLVNVLPSQNRFLLTGGRSDMYESMMSGGGARTTVPIALDMNAIRDVHRRLTPRKRVLALDRPHAWDRLRIPQNGGNYFEARGVSGGKACLLIAEAFPPPGGDPTSTAIGVDRFLDTRQQLAGKFGKGVTPVGIYFAPEAQVSDPITGDDILRSELVHEDPTTVFVDFHGLVMREVGRLKTPANKLRVITNQEAHVQPLHAAGDTLGVDVDRTGNKDLPPNTAILVMQEDGLDPVNVDRIRRRYPGSDVQIFVVTRSESPADQKMPGITYLDIAGLCKNATQTIQTMLANGSTINQIRAEMSSQVQK